jgi:hypothetical protein
LLKIEAQMRFLPLAHFVQFFTLNFLIKILGAFERNRNAWAYISGSNVFFKFGLAHQAGGLFARAAQNEAAV